MNQQKIVVIGGGAAGFFGALNCGLNNPHSKITILETAKQPLGKVKISGGGRCNVTHHCFNPTELVNYYPRGKKELRGAFSRFQPQDTIEWFRQRGVKLKIEDDGRIFPVTDDSQTIINCLTKTAEDLGIKICTQTPVKTIYREDSGFNVLVKSDKTINADKILIATGSNPSAYDWAKNLGHTIKNPVPSLFTFKINDVRLKDLAGISKDNVTLYLKVKNGHKNTQIGSLLVTHWGISGPVTLKLSAWEARLLHENKYKLPLVINWLSEYNYESLKKELQSFKCQLNKQKVINYSKFNLPKRLWQSLIRYCFDNPDKVWAEISNKEIEKLITELIAGVYQINGKGVFKEEFVTCGGIDLREIDFKTMMSKICPNLYFAGEVLDIDGVTGGFNFQNAWTTGWLAGVSMAN